MSSPVTQRVTRRLAGASRRTEGGCYRASRWRDAARRGRLLLLLVALAGCSELSTSPERDVAVSQPAEEPWPVAMRVNDTVPLLLDIRADDKRITGAHVDWSSNRPDRLEIVTAASTGDSEVDLTAQTAAHAVAIARGPVTVTAIVSGAGLVADTLTASMTVLERWVAVTVGGGTVCGLAVNQALVCWGGRPGDGSLFRVGPVPVSAGTRYSAAGGGAGHSCAVQVGTGFTLCWGLNTDGQLGDGSQDDALVPTPVRGGTAFQTVSGGSGFTCAAITGTPQLGPLDANGVYCWGSGTFGTLGTGLSGLNGSAKPTDQVRRRCDPSLPPLAACGSNAGDTVAAADLVDVDVGYDHACALDTEGRAFCWGHNDEGQLGVGARPLGTCGPNASACALIAEPVAGGLRFRSIEAGGGSHTCGLTVDDELYCWGSNLTGQIAGSSSSPVLAPTLVDVGVDAVREVTLGGWGPDTAHSCIRDDTGTAYCWGNATLGQLGSGEELGGSSPPVRVADPSGGPVRWSMLSAGEVMTCGLTDLGVIYCWGTGTLGSGESLIDRALAPRPIDEPPAQGAVPG